jgi:hypothetical protein
MLELSNLILRTPQYTIPLPRISKIAENVEIINLRHEYSLIITHGASQTSFRCTSEEHMRSFRKELEDHVLSYYEARCN